MKQMASTQNANNRNLITIRSILSLLLLLSLIASIAGSCHRRKIIYKKVKIKLPILATKNVKFIEKFKLPFKVPVVVPFYFKFPIKVRCGKKKKKLYIKMNFKTTSHHYENKKEDYNHYHNNYHHHHHGYEHDHHHHYDGDHGDEPYDGDTNHHYDGHHDYGDDYGEMAGDESHAHGDYVHANHENGHKSAESADHPSDEKMVNNHDNNHEHRDDDSDDHDDDDDKAEEAPYELKTDANKNDDHETGEEHVDVNTEDDDDMKTIKYGSTEVVKDKGYTESDDSDIKILRNKRWISVVDGGDRRKSKKQLSQKKEIKQFEDKSKKMHNHILISKKTKSKKCSIKNRSSIESRLTFAIISQIRRVVLRKLSKFWWSNLDLLSAWSGDIDKMFGSIVHY